jgi:NAD(P)-dependent dehydrogenase (short-subunit alcohol dehydrogenase family)
LVCADPIAIGILQRGAYVAILDVNVEAGERAAREHGKRAMFVKCDITSSDEMDNAITAVSKAFEGITLGGVVHAGGVGATQKVSYFFLYLRMDFVLLI